MDTIKRHNRKKAWIRTWVAILAVTAGFTTAHFEIAHPNPVTGKREIVLVSQEKEIEIGSSIYADLQKQSGGMLNDVALNAYVNEVGQRLAAVSDRPDLPFEFVVIDSDIPNAWAAPGGKIAINKGLLNLLSNEDELASVLAHEIAHACARHTAQRIERDILLKGVAYADIAVNPLGLISAPIDINTELTDLKYSRDAEREADIYGMEYLSRAGYNVHAAITTHQKLKAFFKTEENESNSFIDSLYRTHPSDDERIQAGEILAEQYPRGSAKG